MGQIDKYIIYKIHNIYCLVYIRCIYCVYYICYDLYHKIYQYTIYIYIYTQCNVINPKKRRKFCHLPQREWVLCSFCGGYCGKRSKSDTHRTSHPVSRTPQGLTNKWNLHVPTWEEQAVSRSWGMGKNIPMLVKKKKKNYSRKMIWRCIVRHNDYTY